MKRKLQNTINRLRSSEQKINEQRSSWLKSSKQKTSRLWSGAAVLLILLFWQGICSFELVDRFLLPSPYEVLQAFVEEFPVLIEHSWITLTEAFLGLAIGILFGFVMAVLMDQFEILRRAFYPLIVLTQTIPTVAIAPLLVLWFGYEMAPKVILVVITTFFPIAVGLLEGFQAVDQDSVHLLRAMGAGRWQIFRYLKFPSALPQFFSGLRISASYAVVGAVISEWLGGFGGLGVYMTRVKKAFAFDKMFAVIFLISLISLLLMKGVDFLQKNCLTWGRKGRETGSKKAEEEKAGKQEAKKAEKRRSREREGEV